MKHLSIIFCLICASLVYSQECSLSINGTIKDFHDGTLIQDATIYIKQIEKYTTSNSNGVFSINNLCKGNYTLVISHISCEDKTVEIDLTDSKIINVFLEHHIEELNEVTVKSYGGQIIRPWPKQVNAQLLWTLP